MENVVNGAGRGESGWALMVVRHGGECGAELGTVFENTSGRLLIGAGIVGSRRLDGSDTAPVQTKCPRCGYEAEIDAGFLREAVRHQRQSIAIV
jgi:hypothetical protein